MKRFLEKILEIEPEESKRVFLLLGMGFFMGVFLATFNVGANTLFLNNFSEQEDLPYAILSSGVFGIIVTSIYNYYQSRVKFSKVSSITLAAVFALLLLFELGYKVLPDPSPVYFAAFVAMIPFSYLLLLVFWGAFNRVFDLRQAKRIIGGIDTGQLVASILALFSIPLFLKTLKLLEVKDLLTVSMVAVAGIYALFTWLVRGHKQDLAEMKDEEPVSYKAAFKNKYVLSMALFVITAIMAMSFIDFSFLNVTSAQFDQETLPQFLSYFEASVVIFSFLFQTFVTDRIIALYGLKLSLLINPVLILIFTGVAVVVGATLGYTPSQAEGTFIFFFLAIALSKLFVASLRNALDEPAFKLYFLPIESEHRLDIQTKIEGVINAFAGLIAGGFILLIGNIGIFNLLLITIATLPLLGFWYFLTNRLHNGYKNTLQDTLKRNKENEHVEEQREYAVDEILKKQIASQKELPLLYGLKLMEKLEPGSFEHVLGEIKPKSQKVERYVDAKKSAYKSTSGLDVTKALAQKAVKEEAKQNILGISFEQLGKMARSLKPEDRKRAASYFRHYADTQHIFLLLELLRDGNYEVRMEAIATARLIKRPETWPSLIEMLDKVDYGHAAMSALVEAGEAVLFTLETAFNKSGQNDMVMLRIIQIMGKLPGEEVEKLLWKKMDFPNKKIVNQVLISLRNRAFHAEGYEVQVIHNFIEDEVYKALWNLVAITEAPKEEHFHFYRDALKEEVKANFDQIFMLLSLAYDAESVKLVKENIETETSEGVAFGLELLDMFIQSDLKPKLFPLLDDMPVTEKQKQLHLYFPRENYTPHESLKNALNRDYNQLNRWTKACALYALSYEKDFEIDYSVIAHLFNEDILIQEVTAWLMQKRDPEKYEAVSQRLSHKAKIRLEQKLKQNNSLDPLDEDSMLKIEMVMFLKQIDFFKEVPGKYLCDLVDTASIIRLEGGAEWNPSAIEPPSMFALVGGHLKKQGATKTLYYTKSVFGELFALDEPEQSQLLIAEDDSTILQINTNQLYNLMTVHYELTSYMIESLVKARHFIETSA